MRDDIELIKEAYKEWLSSHPHSDTDAAFLAGAKFVIDYLIKKEKYDS